MPSTRRRLTVVVVLSLLVLTLVGLGVTDVEPVAAVGEHRAAIVVDTGTALHTSVIEFSQDSISGTEALQKMPGANPVVYGFAGQGGAVCAIFDLGQPGDSTCLKAPDSRYWAYFRAPAGSSSWTYSRAGPGSVRVRDGDVEGWRFGTGEPPASPVLKIPAPVPPATPATAPPAASDPAPAASGPGGSTGELGLPSSGSRSATIAPTPEAVAAAAAAAVAGGSSTTSTTRKGAAAEVAAERASASRDADDGGGSPVPSIVAFVGVLAVLGAGIFFARRARVGRSAGGS